MYSPNHQPPRAENQDPRFTFLGISDKETPLVIRGPILGNIRLHSVGPCEITYN